MSFLTTLKRKILLVRVVQNLTEHLILTFMNAFASRLNKKPKDSFVFADQNSKENNFLTNTKSHV